jgi:hypothetical protein
MQSDPLARYRWYLLDGVQLTAVGLVALALMPVGAHLFEMAGKMRLGPADYLTVQRVQYGWMLFSLAALMATATVGGHAYLVRRNAASFNWSIVGFFCIAAAQIVFWAVAYPISMETDGWTRLPADFDAARRHWEYALAAAAAFTFGGLLALVRSIEASRPFASISILESIERDAAVRAARMRAQSAAGGSQFAAPSSRETKAA